MLISPAQGASSLEGELRRLRSADIPEACKKEILRFLDDRRARGLSEVRCYNLSIRLRRVASMIPQQFLRPSEDDLKSVINCIKGTKVSLPRWKRDEQTGKAHSVKVETDRFPSVNTMESYKLAIRSFYSWRLGKGRRTPACVQWIRIGKKDRYAKPRNLVTPEELARLIGSARNSRDKAMFQLLYDSGIRMGEMLTLKIGDLEWKPDYGLVAKVSGKTGPRDVIVVGDSVVLLRRWLDNHPFPNEPAAFVFTRVNERDVGRHLTHNHVYKALNDCTDRAGLRRMNPHLFRHTRATLLASNVAEAPLEKQMGWVHGSDMTRVYVHLSRRDQEDAILKAYGIERPDGRKVLKEPRPTRCPRCAEENVSNAAYCRKCWLPLTPAAAAQLREKEQGIQGKLVRGDMVSDEVKSILEGLPDTEKTSILTLIIEKLLDTAKTVERV